MIRGDGLTIAVGGRPLVAGLDIAVAGGRVLALLGPNGVGKSTLLATLAGERPPAAGIVRMSETPMRSVPARDLACRRAVLTQESALAFPFTVAEVVALGRYPHRGRAGPADDRRAIGLARGLARIEPLWQRSYLRLSGGERQRVQFARAVAQVAPIDAVPRALLLDEPTASLDLRFQHEILDGARRLAVAYGVAVAVVTHDPNLAVAYADDILLLRPGTVVFAGPAARLEAAHLAQAYGLTVDRLGDPAGRRLFSWRPAA